MGSPRGFEFPGPRRYYSRMAGAHLLRAAAIVLALAGCERRGPEPLPPPSPQTGAALETMPTLAELDRGARLFQEHCAQCHGPEAQGHPDWETPGVLAAPPLNGTGNDWKRSRAELAHVILRGVERDGAPVMPAWQGRLSEADVNSIIAWFQALWPAEVYDRWQQLQVSARP